MTAAATPEGGELEDLLADIECVVDHLTEIGEGWNAAKVRDLASALRRSLNDCAKWEDIHAHQLVRLARLERELAEARDARDTLDFINSNGVLRATAEEDDTDG